MFMLIKSRTRHIFACVHHVCRWMSCRNSAHVDLCINQLTYDSKIGSHFLTSCLRSILIKMLLSVISVCSSPFCRPIHSCLWSFFCMSLTTWLLCFKVSASLMLDMKWASTMELDGQWRRSRSGKLYPTFTHTLYVETFCSNFWQNCAETVVSIFTNDHSFTQR